MGFSVSNASNIPRAGFSKNRLRLPEYIYQTATGLLILKMKVPHHCRPQIKNATGIRTRPSCNGNTFASAKA